MPPDKSELRFNVDLPVRVFGVDDDDHAFSQMVHARNVSDHGAKLAGLEEHLKPGDIIGVHFGDKTARCNVIWVLNAGEKQKIDVGVKVVEGQPHPWQKELEAQRATGTPVSRIAPVPKDKRNFPRQRICFEIEIRGGQGEDPPMRTRTADIAGSGCYIETMLPLEVGTVLMVTFLLNSERVRTTAIVRTCDSGFGMGIEFTGFDEATQKRLQRQVEAIAVESAEMTSGAEITDVWNRH
jgi:PilZ domain